MSAAHTPGPWIVCISDDDNRAFTIFSEDQLIDGRIETGGWDDHVATAGLNHDECEANARLIAAAPDLLDLLEQALGYTGCQSWSPSLTDEIKAAIAKATGSAA